MKHQSPKKPRRGFTLLEMLVVVVIIAMLAALMFRMVGVIGRNNDEAETRATIERVAHALDEFKAIYGKYPPVQLYEGTQPIGFEYPGPKTWGETPEDGETKANRIVKEGKGGISHWNKDCTIFTFGLVSFFLPRYNGTSEYGPKRFVGIKNGRLYNHPEEGYAAQQWTSFNSRADGHVGDTDRDLNAVRRILPFLGGKLGDDNRVAANGVLVKHIAARPSPFGGSVTNVYYTIWDAWRRDLHYVSRPPYETYKLWSNGLNGVNENGGGDDIVSGQF